MAPEANGNHGPREENMPEFLIQYRVRPDKVEEQEAAIREFIGFIRADADPGVSYSVFKCEDGVSFVHRPSLADDEAQQRLQSRPYFKPFGEGLKERCEEGPKATKLIPVASTDD